jgi:hypothetical protein
LTLLGRTQVKNVALVAAGAAGLEWAVFWFGITWSRVLGGDLRGPDFYSFYAAARLYLARGGAQLYDPAAQLEFQQQVTSQWSGQFLLLPYVHPPYYTLVIAPLGLLPFRTAYIVWAAVNLVLAAAAIAILIRANDHLRGPGAVIAACLAAGFFPLFMTVLQGQSDLVVMLPLAVSYLAWVRGRQGWAGVFAGLALAKPQLLLLIPALFLARRAWPALVGFLGVAAGLGLISLAALGLKAQLGFLAAIGGYAVGGPPALSITSESAYSLRGALEVLPGGRLPALAILLILLCLVALAFSWRPHVPRLDMALAVAASLALSPFQNFHDLLMLLLPGLALADLAHSGRLRWPGAAAGVLTVAYGAINLSPTIGTWAAGVAALGLAAYLVVERLAVRPDPVPLPDLPWHGPRPHRVIVLPAYNAARTLQAVVADIPPTHADRVLLVDDASSDATVSIATELQLDVILHQRNLGYGGNQKTCYQHALAMGADVVVMLHPDGQYDPAIIPELCRKIESGDADIVLGSRWLGLDPARSGMPWWKRFGNRFLTHLENWTLGLDLSEFHTGYRAYSRSFLQAVPFAENSDDFVFDTQILVQAASFGFKIGEVPAVGKYFPEASSVGLQTSVVYGLKTIAVLVRYVWHRAGFRSSWLTPTSATDMQAVPLRQAHRHGHVD